ncbi:MAG: hypothetical protein GC180_10225 [Bacteroidetes bacterium]|nr:hypothetical protein [Bacteroidota bacterium]
MLHSCDEAPKPAEKVYLDTLLYSLKGNEKALSIDEQSLVKRKEIIRQYWLPSIQDTVPDIHMRIEDDLRGMLTAYDFYLNNYLLFQSSTKLLMQECSDFKRATDANEINRSEFKEKYHKLETKIERNTDEIEVIAKPVYDLEPMWLRYEQMMRMRGIRTE